MQGTHPIKICVTNDFMSIVEYSLFMTMFTRIIQRHPGYKPLNNLHDKIQYVFSTDSTAFTCYRYEFITDSVGSEFYLFRLPD
jgi:hypothetical protein